MQGIVTKCLCPTNSRGARIKASCEAGSSILPWDHALNAEDNHRAACRALCKKLDDANAKKYGADCKRTWSDRVWGWGVLPDGCYAHVPCSDQMTVTRMT